MTKTPHLLPQITFTQQNVNLDSFSNPPRREGMKFKQTGHPLTWHFSTVVLSLCIFLCISKCPYWENKQVKLWAFSIARLRQQFDSCCCSSCEFCSSDTGSAIVELGILINNEYSCAEEMWTKQWGFWSWARFRNPARNLSNWLVPESWGWMWNWTLRWLVFLLFSIPCFVQHLCFYFHPLWK